ncbi:hypothetical protein [Frankia sp. AgKG'84/4]|uniref:hypothetical protein n=1 Tax=Frankia sp. AgKG'84/4 TaxID=573490 RepID=UPI0020103D2E|nr:hypothetical protein [Frankia sp. AgKG'84/4]MCL9795364.1 hypothetical protein [Frankia sp. AgKG'84/4]
MVQTSRDRDVVDWTDLGKDLWSYLTGKGAAINYQFVDMLVEVPRDTGPDAARATWRLHGTLRVVTSDNDSAGGGLTNGAAR